MKGWMYILECADSSYYIGSTNNIEVRFKQHQDGKGANHTKKRLPVTLVYNEEFQRIDEAFYREKQVQGWSRKKKEALINGQHEQLPKLSMAYRDLKKMALDASVSSALTSGKELPSPEVLEGTVPSASTSGKELPSPEVLEGTVSSASVSSASTSGEPVPEVLEGKGDGKGNSNNSNKLKN